MNLNKDTLSTRLKRTLPLNLSLIFHVVIFSFFLNIFQEKDSFEVLEQKIIQVSLTSEPFELMQIKKENDSAPTTTSNQDQLQHEVLEAPKATKKSAKSMKLKVAMQSAPPETKDETEINKYEKLISQNINQGKYILSAFQGHSYSNAIVRIRINQSGNIVFVMLDQGSGSEDADRAIISMIKSRSPLPPPPPEYIEEDLAEFLLPIKFN